jgi:hypothetical protein
LFPAAGVVGPLLLHGVVGLRTPVALTLYGPWHLATLGVAPQAPLRTGRGGPTLAFVADPDGNRIERMQIPDDSPVPRPPPLG